MKSCEFLVLVIWLDLHFIEIFSNLWDKMYDLTNESGP